ncbi:MAG TPA: hypothetical protein PLJ26_03725 [Candidatus Omnitrophota bacterium]|nr:hypothetical protein [Candidatus Omnitrophota bacterium]HQJ15571.1 hypothetical protein [Candidatus Omnitrophota bacterium]
MKRFLFITTLISLCFTCASAQPGPKAKLVLFISEQNINTPRSAWWASEVDLSATEAEIARQLLSAGYEIIEPGAMDDVINKEKAFRLVDLSEKNSIKMASLANADYVVLGKAVASAGGTVPYSNMRSCFANLTAKVIDVKTRRVIAYLDASGNSAHMDVISGGREALVSAGGQIAAKIVEKLNSMLQQRSQ